MEKKIMATIILGNQRHQHHQQQPEIVVSWPFFFFPYWVQIIDPDHKEKGTAASFLFLCWSRWRMLSGFCRSCPDLIVFWSSWIGYESWWNWRKEKERVWIFIWLGEFAHLDWYNSRCKKSMGILNRRQEKLIGGLILWRLLKSGWNWFNALDYYFSNWSYILSFLLMLYFLL